VRGPRWFLAVACAAPRRRDRGATHKAIEAVFRIESAKIIAGVARMVRDVGLAEELAQDALVAALETWPARASRQPCGVAHDDGQAPCPRPPAQRKLHAEKEDELTREIEELLEEAQPRVEANLRDDIGDDLLRLVFTACHPVLSTEARVALTLRSLGGLTTDEIARAFLVPEPTIAQRIVRAKRTLAEARVPFEVPGAAERAERLAAVLEVIYLVFNEGYSATSGEDWTRPALCEDALRLGACSPSSRRTSRKCTASSR
jgi:predicted RNA polymerase sigma factor